MKTCTLALTFQGFTVHTLYSGRVIASVQVIERAAPGSQDFEIRV
jgi:hypothetical protein